VIFHYFDTLEACMALESPIFAVNKCLPIKTHKTHVPYSLFFINYIYNKTQKRKFLL
jgi:hypothetical protein